MKVLLKTNLGRIEYPALVGKLAGDVVDADGELARALITRGHGEEAPSVVAEEPPTPKAKPAKADIKPSK